MKKKNRNKVRSHNTKVNRMKLSVLIEKLERLSKEKASRYYKHLKERFNYLNEKEKSNC